MTIDAIENEWRYHCPPSMAIYRDTVLELVAVARAAEAVVQHRLIQSASDRYRNMNTPGSLWTLHANLDKALEPFRKGDSHDAT